jgi:hypothetical protein
MITTGFDNEMIFYLDAYKTPTSFKDTNLTKFKTITTRLYNKNGELLLVCPIQETINFSANINWESGPSSILESFISGFSQGASVMRSVAGDFAEAADYISNWISGKSVLPEGFKNKLNSELNKVTINQYDARKKFAGSYIEPPSLTMSSWLVDDGTEEDYIIKILNKLTDTFIGDIKGATGDGGGLSQIIGNEEAPNGYTYIQSGDLWNPKVQVDGTFSLQIGEFIVINNLVVSNYSLALQTVNAFDKKPLMANINLSLTPVKKFTKSDFAGWYDGTKTDLKSSIINKNNIIR